MFAVSLLIAQVIIALAMVITVWRIMVGPHVADRVVAFDLLTALIVGQIGLMAAQSGHTLYLEIALAIAVITFFGTVSLALYVEGTRHDAP